MGTTLCHQRKVIFKSAGFFAVFYLAWCLAVVRNESNLIKTKSTSRPPIELQHIGYYGSWERFCDRKEIDKDFPIYPDHEQRMLRIMICKLKEQNNITRDTVAPLAGYKYCEMMRMCADDFLDKLIDRFSQGDDKKKAELLERGPVIDATLCFNHAITAFDKLCIDKENPFFRMFRPLLARACVSRWLTTENIVSHIAAVCTGKRMTANIDWETVLMSIPYRE